MIYCIMDLRLSGSQSKQSGGRVIRLLVQPLLAVGILQLFAPPAGLAQGYPSRPIRLVVPFPPGGTIDIVGRILAEKLGERMGRPVVVDNRGGAGGVVGADVVAKAAPDGHTLLLCSQSTLITSQLLMQKPPYDSRRDFAPVTVLLSVPYLLLVRPNGGLSSVKDLIAQAKQRPGEINFASAGNGSSSHLSALLFTSIVGIQVTHVPYKGSTQAVTEMLGGGQTHFIFEAMAAGVQYARSGRLRALGLTSLRRSPLMPDVPTFTEAGVPGFEMSTWHAVCAPSGTPASIVDKLNAESLAAIDAPETRERLTAIGAELVGSTREQMRQRIEQEFVRWQKLIREMGLREQR